jgi:hypothetical protein
VDIDLDGFGGIARLRQRFGDDEGDGIAQKRTRRSTACAVGRQQRRPSRLFSAGRSEGRNSP